MPGHGLGGHTRHGRTGGDIGDNHGAGRDNRSLADLDPLFDHRTGADVHAGHDMDPAADYRAGRHMRVIADRAVMLHERPCIDENVGSQGRARPHVAPGQYLAPLADDRVSRYRRTAMENRHGLKTCRHAKFVKPAPDRHVGDRTHADREMTDAPVPDFPDLFIAADNGHADDVLTPRGRVGAQRRDGDVLSRIEDRVHNNGSMAPGAENDTLRLG